MRIRLCLVTACTAMMFAGASLEAQGFPAFGGIEGRIGVAMPENADPGVSASVDLDLGSLGIGSLRTIVGAHYFSANRTGPGTEDYGSYSAVGGRLGLRLDVFGTQRLSPFIMAALTGHQISANVPNESDRALLEGFNTGASIGAGLAYAVDEAGRLAVTGEGRGTFTNNIQHYALELGMRFLPRGPRSYLRAPGIPGPMDTGEAARLAREREEIERRRLENLRQETERERLARIAEEERRRTGQQVDAAQREAELARQRAAEAEAARAQEAEARARAERAAAEAAVGQEAAAAAAREAQQRAAQAEQRLYESLLDLNRLIANVTGIRETERGLVVVVGQGLFASGQYNLSPTARNEVGRIAAVLAQYPEHRISVEGHTDAVGSEVSNQALSERRANSVRAALVAQGIDPGRVTAVGFGQNNPIAGNATAADRAQNRRVEIVILGARRPTAP
jgi:outer membrane protein OmpA-like peptidoglycan-associated protein